MAVCLGSVSSKAQQLKLNDKDYFETTGVNVMVFSNPFNPIFYDEKRSGIDIVHHGVMTVTNGGVRLVNTPEQWDLVPTTLDRVVNHSDNSISVKINYPEYDFQSVTVVAPKGNGFTISVYLDKPVPASLVGDAGFNLEFLPSAYWNKSYMVDGKPLYFPRYPSSDTEVRPKSEKVPQIDGYSTFDDLGRDEFIVAKPIAQGHQMVMAPEDDARRVLISSETPLSLYDGRLLAQNGWFVVRSLLPAGQTGKVLEWYVEPSSIRTWKSKPVVGYSQVGYIPSQKKTSVIELDGTDTPLPTLTLYKVNADGSKSVAKTMAVKPWGKFMRYQYATADFSDITEPGIYCLKYGDQITNTFPIGTHVYDEIWHPTLDVWFPVQMDHMKVKEGYRVWHGAPFLDDLVQAPVNNKHFDNFNQGPSTNSPYESLQYIPGFDAGGWFDAGDFDIETNSHNGTLLQMIGMWENFRPERDMTYIDQKTKYVNIHRPDGKPDLLQQIEHGVLPIVAMVETTGHACRGVNFKDLYQYNHLGDASTITDNKPGTGDERWLFTDHNPMTDYQTCAALAATYRPMKDFNPSLADRCLKAALKIWNDNKDKPRMPGLVLQAALQLYKSTGDKVYLNEFTMEALGPSRFMPYGNIDLALQVAPYMNKNFIKQVRPMVEKFKAQIDSIQLSNPYGVNPIAPTWGGNGGIIAQSVTAYWAHKYFPELIGKEEVFKAANYLFGCHPTSNKSFVMGVGVTPKEQSYSNNRADFSFIAGAVVPGLLMLQPDYMENKDDWPYFWGQNESTIGINSQYLFYCAALQATLAEE